MICAATLWSIAGVFTRHLEEARSFEVTFWRSVFAAIFMMVVLACQHRSGTLAKIQKAGWVGVFSGFCWAMMFIGFMLSLTLTTTANTLVICSLTPLVTAIFAWVFLKQRTPRRTWVAIAIAFSGIVVMFAGSLMEFGRSHLLGISVAMMQPIFASANFVIFQKSGRELDLIPSVLLGAIFSALIMLPLAMPFKSSLHDIGIMAVLGVFQLGLACVLLIIACRSLSAPEVALLAMLEVVLGPFWAWIGAGEVPASTSLLGGVCVLVALAINEIGLLRQLGRMNIP